ncbi:hypothetical protein ACFLZ9_00275 [Patescibacteria group bacterium]
MIPPVKQARAWNFPNNPGVRNIKKLRGVTSYALPELVKGEVN